MYAGFITPKKVVKVAGIHQRLDGAAYKMIARYLADDAFPQIDAIIGFEGYNGPDGLKTKTGLKPRTKDDEGPSHLYDPVRDEGDVPGYIDMHYRGLVRCLVAGDQIRGAFEAAWLAHYVGDGLTPAHHWPLEEKLAEAAADAAAKRAAGDISKTSAIIRKHWAIWGAKGHMSTHFNFEMGVAFALMLFPIKPTFSDAELGRARQLGPVEYFKSEAREVAGLQLYERFYKDGWTNDIASIVKKQLAPQTARTIGIIWLLAYLEAGQQLATSESS